MKKRKEYVLECNLRKTEKMCLCVCGLQEAKLKLRAPERTCKGNARHQDEGCKYHRYSMKSAPISSISAIIRGKLAASSRTMPAHATMKVTKKKI